ncbi:NYN domain-containing protein [Lawsonella clevelandensis]|uniref:NYN domain-containing protein n=1 Tax=Lawsonella clevelandensis TaxID=1528099 RepID=UPI0026EC76CE|nr:NYN domain-containing protein [Lawsonella clevelandensis]
MVDRVEVFVDTSYLLASFYNSWTTGARAQLEIDLPAVTDHLNTIVSNKLHLPVHRQLWYDGIPDSGPHRYQRTLRHIDGVQLRAGQLIEWGDRRTQKAVDTRLVADMVLRSIRGLVSDIVLVSGDADMIPGVEAAIDHGVRVHLIGFGWDSISNSLRSACDTVTVLDPREDFADCMHIDVLDPFHTDNTSEHSDLATDGQTNGPADSGTGNHSEQGNSDISSPVSSSDAANTTGSTAGNTGEGTAADMPGDMAHSSTATHPYASTGDTADEDENTDGANVLEHGVPLVPPVLSPGKFGHHGVRRRLRIQHATIDDTASTTTDNVTDSVTNSTTDTAANSGTTSTDATTDASTDVSATDKSVNSFADDSAISTTDSADSSLPADTSLQSSQSSHEDTMSGATADLDDDDDVTSTAAVEAANKAKANNATPETSAQPDAAPDTPVDAEPASEPVHRPSPGMMAQKRRPPQRSRYVPLPYDEVWESAGNQTPFDIGQQYAIWWYNNAATLDQRGSAHILTGGGLPAEIDRPLLQFACQILDAYTLSDAQRVNLRDGFHMGIRGIIMGG